MVSLIRLVWDSQRYFDPMSISKLIFYAVVRSALVMSLLLAGRVEAQEQGGAASPEPSASVVTETSDNRQILSQLDALNGTLGRIATVLEARIVEHDSDAKNFREESDLAAQWEMAKWAKLMFKATVVQVFFSALGVFLLLYSLRMNRLATNAAIEAASAAKRDTEINIALQLPAIRAMVTHIGVGSDNRRLVQLNNFGNGTAQIKQDCLIVEICDELRPEPTYDPKSIIRFANITPFEKGQTAEIKRYGSITREDAREILNGTKHLWVYGFVDYLDFLIHEHRVGFCARAVPIPNVRYDKSPPSDWTFIPAGPVSYVYEKLMNFEEQKIDKKWWRFW